MPDTLAPQPTVLNPTAPDPNIAAIIAAISQPSAGAPPLGSRPAPPPTNLNPQPVDPNIAAMIAGNAPYLMPQPGPVAPPANLTPGQPNEDDSQAVQNEMALSRLEAPIRGIQSPVQYPQGAPHVGEPIIMSLIRGLRTPANVAAPGVAAPSRAEVFEKFLGNFLDALGQGMGASGRGPGANERGFGAALTGPYNRSVQQYQLQQQQQQQQAAIAEQQARTGLATSQAGALTNFVPYADVNGQIRMVPIGQLGKVAAADIAGGAKVTAAETGAKNRIDLEKLKDASPLQLAQAALANANADFRDSLNDASSPQYKLALQKVQWANYSKQLALQMRGESLDLSRQKFDFQTNGPTSNQRTQGQMASDILQQLPRIKAEIALLGAQGKLGPIEGRYEEFMAGKVGAGDPAYAGLRTDLSLTATALMKAHVGAKGSESIMAEFKNMLNPGKDTPEQLDATMGSVANFLTTYARAATYAPGGKPAAAPPPLKPTASVVGGLLSKYGGGQ